MKYLKIVLIIFLFIVYSCKKENLDEIFESRMHRYLTGVWEVNGISVNGIDSSLFLLNNDSLCTRWDFKFIPDSDIVYYFWYYNKKNDYGRGSWKLNERYKNINVSADRSLSPENIKINRWFYSGYWDILELNKNNMKLRFKHYNIEYEYSFNKIKDN